MLQPRQLMSAIDDPGSVELYIHKKKPEWGLALFVWKSGHKIVYQFEDGVFRKFRAEFAEMFEAQDLGEDEHDAAVRMLIEALGDRLPGEVTGGVSATAAVGSSEFLGAQIALFRENFAKGFGSDEWQQAYRGADYPRVKKHVDSLISDAQEQLSVEECDRLIAADEPHVIWEKAMAILKQGDLVTPAKLKKFAQVETSVAGNLGVALRERLYGEEGERGRFLAFQKAGAAATGEEVPWGVATAIPALIYPTEHIVVRPTNAKEFLKQLELEADVPKIPQYPWYRRLRELHNEVRERLDSEGFSVEDLMDIHLFLKVTLARAARERLEVLLNAARNARMGE